MRRIIQTISLLLIANLVFSQCVPPVATGNPGFLPSYQNLPCIEQGVAYNEVITFENFTTINTPFGNATITSLTIDSITNIPCNLGWTINPGSTLASGATACIDILGTTNDPIGQYQLAIYLTVEVNVPILGQQTLSGEASDLVDQIEGLTGQPAGIDPRYYLRVIMPAATCPVVDTTITGLGACGGPPPCPNIVVNISSTDETASGANDGTASVAPSGGPMPYTYDWDNGDTTAAISGLAPGTYRVAVFDSSGCVGIDSTVVGTPGTAGCSPISPTGTPGFTPSYFMFPCAEQGVAYSEVINFENLDSLVTPLGVITVNSIRFDSIKNLPCDLEWDINPSNTLSIGETACISISGITNDTIGQYELEIWITINLSNPLVGVIETSGELKDLIDQIEGFGIAAPIDPRYYVRVKEGGVACTPVDTNAFGLLSCGKTPCLFDVDLAVTDETVAGANNGSIIATPNGGASPYIYNWNNGGSTATINNLIPGAYDVTVTDTLGCFAFGAATVQPGAVGIYDIDELVAVSVFPNPTTGEVNLSLQFETAESIQIELFNMLGERIINEYYSDVLVWNNTYNLNKFSEGIYFFKIRFEDGQSLIRKVSLQR